MAQRDWQNSALTMMAQASDMIAGDILRRKEEMRQKQWRDEAWQREDERYQNTVERQDRRDMTNRKLSVLEAMGNTPDITPESRTNIMGRMMDLIADPNVEINPQNVEREMYPVPPEWDKAMGGFFSRSGKSHLPASQYMRFKTLYDQERDRQWEKEYKGKELETREKVARINSQNRGRSTSKTDEPRLKQRGEILARYRQGAAAIANQGGFPTYDEFGEISSLEPYKEELLQEYLKAVDHLEKQIASGQWTEEDEKLFRDLSNFMLYHEENQGRVPMSVPMNSTMADYGGSKGRKGKNKLQLDAVTGAAPKTKPSSLGRMAGKKSKSKQKEEDPFGILDLLETK